MDKKLIGNRIKDIRNSKRLSQIEFAGSLGISQAALSKIEGGGGISFDTIDAICKLYNIELQEITGKNPGPWEELERLRARNKELEKENKQLKKQIASR